MVIFFYALQVLKDGIVASISQSGRCLLVLHLKGLLRLIVVKSVALSGGITLPIIICGALGVLRLLQRRLSLLQW